MKFLKFLALGDPMPDGRLPCRALAARGLIVEANLTATTLLGLPRSALVGHSLHVFVAKEDQDIFYLLCKQLLKTGAPQALASCAWC